MAPGISPEGRKRQAHQGGVSLPGALSLSLSLSPSLSLCRSPLCRPANLQPLCNLILHLGGGLWSASLPATPKRMGVRASESLALQGVGKWDTSAGSYEPKVLRPTKAAHRISGSVEARGPGSAPAWVNKNPGLNSGFDASAWPTAPPRLRAEGLARQRATWAIRLAPTTVQGGAVQCATHGALLEARFVRSLAVFTTWA
jgi:hypothetical protein